MKLDSSDLTRTGKKQGNIIRCNASRTLNMLLFMSYILSFIEAMKNSKTQVIIIRKCCN
jgi:hypothetical protein